MNIRNNDLTKSIEVAIRRQVADKKLSDKKIKDFLNKYYDGDPTMTCPTGCKGTCQLDCYIEIHKALIDDNNKHVSFGELYKRDNAYHCCGKEVSTLKNNLYCIVCGGEYKN